MAEALKAVDNLMDSLGFRLRKARKEGLADGKAQYFVPDPAQRARLAAQASSAAAGAATGVSVASKRALAKSSEAAAEDVQAAKRRAV
jgi:hypothetical protein